MSAVFDYPQGQALPHSDDAEQAVLGGLMLVNEAYPRVAGWLEAENFYRRDHQLIFSAIVELAEKSQPFDAVTLGDWFAERGESELVGNGAYLIDLAANTGSAANVEAYAEIVRERAQRRALIEIASQVIAACHNPDGRSTEDLAGDAVRELSGIGATHRGAVMNAAQAGRLWWDDFQKRYEHGSGPSGLCLPWTAFNERTGGLNPGDLVIVAGRPGMGKSAWAINALTSVAMRGKRALIFSLEMTAAQIYNRAIASIAEIPLSWMRSPDDENEDYWTRVTTHLRMLKESGLLIDDTPGLAWPQIEARATREALRGVLGLIVVDHLHLIPLPGKTRETVEIGAITAGAKKLAKKHKCPVVLLSQLNRSVEQRANKRPSMADLRESGNIEQDADVIVFLYRDDYYAKLEGRQSQAPNIVEMNIAKLREGEPGRVLATANLAYARLEDREDQSLAIVETVGEKRGGMR